MLKRLLSAITGAILFLSIPAVGLAVERYEVLQVGDEDSWVMELQEHLYDAGYLKVPATGYYGTNTQNAVISYQRDHGLSVDGKAGPVTRKAILGDAYQEITGPRGSEDAKPSATKAPVDDADEPTENEASAEPTAEPEPTETPKPDKDESLAVGDVLQLGDKGEAISALQEKLKEYDYYDYATITGYFGPVTKDAVLRFQRTYNLTEDGIVGPEARAILDSGDLKYYTLREGDRGDDVQEMQVRLRKLGYLDGTATGYFGDVTRRAVESFQSANGLDADGTVGKNTRSVLFSDDAVQSDGDTSETTQDGGEPATLSSGDKTDDDKDDKDQPEASKPPVSSSKLKKFLEVAEGRVGKSYVYGAVGPNSFDCSGFVYYCLKGAGVGVSRLSSAGYASFSSWKTISSKKDLEIGDLIFFRSDSSSSISHVGIYLGGGNFIHAAPSLKGVGYSTMSSGYYSRNFVSGKRVF